MENTTQAPSREKINVEFIHLPAYSQFLLHNALDEFVMELIRLNTVNDLPLLRFFKSMDSDQLTALAAAAQREMLTLIAANRAGEYIENSIHSWLTNQIPLITREQVQSQDITLVNSVKATVLRKFLRRYTDDVNLLTSLVEEIDQFVGRLNAEMFASFILLQQQEIHKVNEALAKREQQLLEAQAIGQIGSFEWDLIGKQSSFTPQMFKIFEMAGPSNVQAFLQDIHPEDRQKVRQAMEKAFVDGDYECEYRYVRNGREKVIYSRGKVQFAEGRPARMVGTITDVTERHRIIKKLQESEALHKQAQALTHIGNWSWTVDEDKISWSDEMYRIYGLAPQSETITFNRFIAFIHPEDREHRISEIKNSLETLQVKEYHFRITAADGKSKVLRGKGEVVAGSDGKARVMLGTCQDVTREFMLTQQLREREKYLEELNRSLESANRELRRSNEELESFNFIASHDLQEPLRKIQVYSNRILENGLTELPSPLPDYFSRINHASKRMQKLIEDFLAFSQTFKANQSCEQVDLNKVMEEILSELSTRIEEKAAQVRVDHLPSIYAVPFQIKQLLINLISNSLKYSREGVPPDIVVTGSHVAASEVPFEGSADNYLKVTVKDNGIGFEPKYKEKIFELFQRLHSRNAYSGTGIGLALCKKIVLGLKGHILAESEPGKGSTFTFYLPQD